MSYAESRFKKVVELEPNFARGWLGLAEVSILKNNFDDASSYLDEALLLKPDLYEAVYFKGLVMKLQNKCDEFIGSFEKIDLTPSNRLNLLISNCYLELNKNKEAEIFFDSSKKDLIEDYDLLAEHYFLKGNYSKSKEIISKNPESYKDPKYWQLRVKALIYNYYGMEKEALKIAKEGIKQAKKSGAPDGLNAMSLLVDSLSK